MRQGYSFSGVIAAGAVLLSSLGGFWGLSPAAGKAPSPFAPKFEEVRGIVQDKCMSCHAVVADLPFYAKIPGIKQIIEKDYRDGLRAMDLSEDFGKKSRGRVNEATLAKMEWVTINETMPPAKFAAIHWDSRISHKQRERILGWVEACRAEYYAADTVAPGRRNEPVQPLPEKLDVDARKAALGKKLFEDTRLSVDDTVSCASCHALEKGGADARRFSEGVRKQLGDINSPTVFNAAFNIRQFWNGRAADLKEQAGGPPFNPVEMGSRDWNEIIAKLRKDRALSDEFLLVYPAAPSGGWSGANIADAVAEYEKTLLTPNSRFDKWLKGDDKALARTELDGYLRFKAYRCSSCHVGMALGGQSFEYMNLKKDYFMDRGGDAQASDAGLQGFTGKAEDVHKFKVPLLRNVELTAPYLHDGTVSSLDEAVGIMGVYLAGMDVTEQDRALIVAFLRTLTGEFQGEKVKGEPVPR